MESSVSAFPDWSNLPSPALELISQKVKSITDYVRFRVVCAPWRSASLEKPRHLPHQLPWLMIPYDPFADDGIRLFYDLWQDKMHKIHLPETIGNICCASYRGWLLLVAPNGRELFLLNPLTRARVELPPFKSPEACNISMYFSLEYFDINKITFSADPTDLNCLIMVFLHDHQEIFFCHVGDHYWTHTLMNVVGDKVDYSVPNPLKDVAYNNGNFYLLYDGVILICDLNQQKLQDTYIFKLSPYITEYFFLEGKAGLYVVAVRYIKQRKNARDRGQKIELYQVQEQPMELKRIADTSQTTIFQGDKHNYLAVSADEWDSLHGGCMYVQCSPWVPSAGKKRRRNLYDICFSKLDDGKPESVVLGFCEHSTSYQRRPAIWFQPSFV